MFTIRKAFSFLFLALLILGGCKKEERRFGPSSFTTCDMTSEIHVNQDSVTTDSVAYSYELGNMVSCEVYERDFFAFGPESMQLREHLLFQYNSRSKPTRAMSIFDETVDTVAYFDYDGELLKGATFFSRSTADRYTLNYQGDKVSDMLVEDLISGTRWYLTYFYQENGQLDHIMGKTDPNAPDEDALMYYVELDMRYKNSRYMKPTFSALEGLLALDFFVAFELESVTLVHQGETVDVETAGLVVASNPQGYVTQREKEGTQTFWTYQCR